MFIVKFAISNDGYCMFLKFRKHSANGVMVDFLCTYKLGIHAEVI